jgi:hypothetical protein
MLYEVQMSTWSKTFKSLVPSAYCLLPNSYRVYLTQPRIAIHTTRTLRLILKLIEVKAADLKPPFTK